MTADGSRGSTGFEEFARANQRRLYRRADLLCGDAEGARDLTRTAPAKLFRYWHRASEADHPADSAMVSAPVTVDQLLHVARDDRFLHLVRYADAFPMEPKQESVHAG